MPVIMKQIVFTSKEVQELSGVSSSAASRNLKKLVELNIIVPDTQYNKKTIVIKVYMMYLWAQMKYIGNNTLCE